ncbi:MAG TPA: hypothetical protein DCK79_01820 [Candidatus Atribacteria bacterium]|jgi:predicted RNA binding protein YcfA (HicA-like mRNA interferase family)|nr:hypothetical protein [Candidatus Atribacteria bacterium]
MHKLPSITPQKVIRILERKGFVVDRAKGSHRIYYHSKGGRRVVIPYHRKDLPKGTLMEILKQASIDKEELVKLL